MLSDSSNAFVPTNQKKYQNNSMYPFQGSPAQGFPADQFNMNPNVYMMAMQQQQQHQVNHKIQMLTSECYVINMHDQQILRTLDLQELSYVHEFYEVLDSQILKLKHDQEIKLQRTQHLRNIAFELIRDQIQSVYKRKSAGKSASKLAVKVEIYGSMATGLAIDTSDLDILVHDFIDHNSPRFHQMTRQEMIEEMQMLHSELNGVSALKSNTLIDTASVPVIKLQMNLAKLIDQ